MFLCHGAPDLVLEENEYTGLLKEIGKQYRPKAIVLFTAHWETEVTAISSVAGTYDMIYDFYGFPAELYRKQYPAKGSPQLAQKVKKLLEANKIPSNLDDKRGMDHGTWSLLSIMYPEADIPVVQVSVNPFRPMEEQFRIGEALKSLAEEDILIIGSGSTVHNLGTLNGNAKKPESWAVEFDDWMIDKVEHLSLKELYNYQALAPHARLAVPREEHIVPLFIAMGSGQTDSPKLLHRSYAYGTFTYLGFEF
jgi:4,5-DOPA dioxygenase extradiol